MRRFSIWILILAGTCTATTNPPRIFYSDIESGPNSGGENEDGAFVTLYGARFGAQKADSAVTIGGTPAAAYPVWKGDRITFQVGKGTSSGVIQVHTSAGASNPLPFTIRPGRIRFVSQRGKDSAKGSATAPWRTVLHARDAMGPGDITYVRQDAVQATNDDWSACFLLAGKGGTPDRPISLVAYPGDHPTIGSEKATAEGGCDFGIRNKGQGEDYWVIAGFDLRGGGEGLSIYGTRGWRVIANDISCPRGDGPSACLGTGKTDKLAIFGNRIHDTGRPGASALYHGVYLGTDSNHVNFGWNEIANVNGCRGLHVHSSGGADLFDLQIHDNLIHDVQCDGIILATVDPSKPGGVNIWNNIIYNAGKGPNTPERSGTFFCINVQGWTNAGEPGSGTIEVFNNTMYACGNWSNPPYEHSNGAISMNGPNPAKRLRLRNNIFYQTTPRPFLVADDGAGRLCRTGDECGRVYGSDNLFYGPPPLPSMSHLQRNLRANPDFADLLKFDFNIGPRSRAARGGAVTPHSSDRQGFEFDKCDCRPIGASAAPQSGAPNR